MLFKKFNSYILRKYRFWLFDFNFFFKYYLLLLYFILIYFFFDIEVKGMDMILFKIFF